MSPQAAASKAKEEPGDSAQEQEDARRKNAVKKRRVTAWKKAIADDELPKAPNAYALFTQEYGKGRRPGKTEDGGDLPLHEVWKTIDKAPYVAQAKLLKDTQRNAAIAKGLRAFSEPALADGHSDGVRNVKCNMRKKALVEDGEAQQPEEGALIPEAATRLGDYSIIGSTLSDLWRILVQSTVQYLGEHAVYRTGRVSMACGSRDASWEFFRMHAQSIHLY